MTKLLSLTLEILMDHCRANLPVGNQLRPHERGGAPSGFVKSRSTSRSSRPFMPNTPAEAMAQAHLLLNFPPAPDKMDEWRATIQSLLSFTDTGGAL